MTTPLRKAAASTSGMTLVESIVVILVIIGITVVVFMGTRTWKKDADRTACIDNIRNVQLVVRSFQNLHGLPSQSPFNIRDELIGPDRPLASEPQCPSYGLYEYAELIPPVGRLAATCSLSDTDSHHPTSSHDW